MTGRKRTWQYALSAAVGALLATAPLHVLLLFTPRPFAFFGWIVTLVTAVAVLMPFSTTAEIAAKVATAVLNLLTGIAIGSLVSSVGARSLSRRPGQFGATTRVPGALRPPIASKPIASKPIASKPIASKPIASKQEDA